MRPDCAMLAIVPVHILQHVCNVMGRASFDSIVMLRCTCEHLRLALQPPDYSHTSDWTEFEQSLDLVVGMSDWTCEEYAVAPYDVDAMALWYPPWHRTSALFDAALEMALRMRDMPEFAQRRAMRMHGNTMLMVSCHLRLCRETYEGFRSLLLDLVSGR